MESPLFIEEAQVIWNSEEPISLKFNDLYFYKDKAIEESEYVFILANELVSRWELLQPRQEFNILELGFGAALNFTTTLKNWDRYNKSKNWLNYVAIERYPLSFQDISKVLKKYKEIGLYSKKLLENYPLNCKGIHRVEFIKEKVSLSIYFGEVADSLKDLNEKNNSFDAIFHDGFSPKKNVDMWSQSVFKSLFRLSNEETSYSTFSSSKHVAEKLGNNGFEVNRIKGFDNKRHMIIAKSKSKKNLYKLKDKKSIAIVGAGIAGSVLAKKLYDKGHKVTIFEKDSKFNYGPSSFETLILYPRLSAFDSSYSLFCLHSYLYATKFYDSLNSPYWKKTGVLLLDYDKTTKKRFNELESSRNDRKIFKRVNKKEASELSGIDLKQGGLFFKEAGWINPKKLIRDIFTDNSFNLVTEEVVKVSKNKVFSINNTYSFDRVCLCNSFEYEKLIDLKGLSKKRGQVTYIKKELGLQNLKIPICGQGYVSPSSENSLIVGSTYSNNYKNKRNLKEDEENLMKLKKIIDEDAQVISSNFGYRSTTPDHLPILGNFEDIFLNIGHGSRGSISAPISAQFIADLIDGSPPIFGQKLISSLDPNRFMKKS